MRKLSKYKEKLVTGFQRLTENLLTFAFGATRIFRETSEISFSAMKSSKSVSIHLSAAKSSRSVSMHLFVTKSFMNASMSISERGSLAVCDNTLICHCFRESSDSLIHDTVSGMSQSVGTVSGMSHRTPVSPVSGMSQDFYS